MYNPEHRQYILKNSLGVSYHVFFEQGRGLCIRMLSDSRIWSRGYVLDKSATDDFSVLLDKNDIFHFIFQNREGKLLYGHGMHGHIEVQPILESRDPTPWSKHVSLQVLKNGVIFFYTIKHQNRYLLSSQSIQEGRLSKPAAVDYIEESEYIAFTDGDLKCHLLYVTSDKSGFHLNHRTVKDDLSTFSHPEKIYSCKGNISSLSAVCTDKNEIYLIFKVSGNEADEIMYKNTASDQKPEILYRSKTDPGRTGLVYCNGTLYFFRVSDENIYFRSLNSNSAEWSDEELYPFGNNITCFSYISNYSNDGAGYFREIPGNFSRGYQIAFLNDAKVKTVQERKPVSNIDSSEIHNLDKKILMLQNLVENMQKELTKLWVTQKNFEKKLEHLERSYAELNDILSYQPENYNETPDTPGSNQTGETESQPV